MQAFVGPNYPVYKRKWEKTENNPGKTTWHWPAFLIGVAWMGYRKMYLASFIIIGVVCLITFFEYLFGVSDRLSNVISIGIGMGLGFSGNALYLWHVRNKLAAIEAVTPPDRLALEAARQGGTSVLAGIGMFLLLFVVLLVEIVVLEALLYG